MEMKEFMNKTENLWKIKLEVDRIKELKTAAEKELSTAKWEVLKLMEELELDKQQVPGYGSCSISNRTSYKTPKTPEAKRALFNWISETKGKDVLANMISINSATLNSFTKEEFANAMASEDFDFTIPGLEEPSISQDIRFTKERK